MSYFFAENIGKVFDNFALKNISIQADLHDIVGIIGKNGAGKTTFLRSIVGNYPNHEGQVWINNETLQGKDINLKRKIAYLPENVGYPSVFTIKELGHILNKFYPKWNQEHFDELIDQFEINRNPCIKEQSTGSLKKIGIAATLSTGSEILILDEPTSNVDPVSREQILQVIKNTAKNEEVLILFSSHILYDIWNVANKIIVINNGEKIYDANLIPDIGNKEFEQEILDLMRQ